MFLDFFVQAESPDIRPAEEYPNTCLGARITRTGSRAELPDSPAWVLMGITDFRELDPEARPDPCLPHRGGSEAADRIRAALYTLNGGEGFPPVTDLGNLITGLSAKDTHAALASVTAELLDAGHYPVWIGGTLEHLRGIFSGFSNQGPSDVSVVSSRTHFKTDPLSPDHEKVLRHLVEKDSAHLFNLSCLAGQGHWMEPGESALLEQLRFEQLRLGVFRQHPDWAEPLLRSSNLAAFSLGSVRWSDADGNPRGGPNGLWAHEFCQLAYYAGSNDALKAFFLTDYLPGVGALGAEGLHSGAHTSALALWYLLDGIARRYEDVPKANSRHYTRYTMALQGNHELVFIKSQKSGRWWLEVALPQRKGSKKERTALVPCTYDDYLKACADELPDRWWRIHQKYLTS